MLAGGYDKKIPFEPLVQSLRQHVRAVVLTGDTGEKIEKLICSAPDYDGKHLKTVLKKDFQEAVLAAKDLAREGGCVLLSPACASFDAFKNFAHRGNTFRKIVENFEN